MPIRPILTKKKLVWGNTQNDLKLIPVKFLYFSQRKNLFKVFDTKIFIFYALNQVNISIYSKIEFIQ